MKTLMRTLVHRVQHAVGESIQFLTAALAFATALAVGEARAALPAPVPPTSGAGVGDWLNLIKGYIKDGGIILGLAISVVGFLWVAYMGIAKFNEARNGRAEWAEVGVWGVAGAALLLFIGFLLTQASTVID